MENRFPSTKLQRATIFKTMPRPSIIASLITASVVALCCIFMLNTPSSNRNRYQGPEFDLRRLLIEELESLSQDGANGDCIAAYKVGRYHMYYSLDEEKAIVFFRIATRCPNANAHASLISILAGKSEYDSEVDKILSELIKMDPQAGESASVHVSHLRLERTQR
jgi:hypothetical protein